MTPTGFEADAASRDRDCNLRQRVGERAALSGAVSADLARIIDAWPRLPAHVRGAVLGLVDGARPPADLAGALDRTFFNLDRQAGGHNFVSLADLRRELAGYDRAAVDAELGRLRKAGRYSLAAAEGRRGLTSAERDAAIAEDGQLLLYLSRRP
jgi:hypothetical protein